MAIDANCRGHSIEMFPASRARAVQGGLAFLRRLMRLTSDRKLAKRGCCDTLPEIFSRGTGWRREARLALGLFASVHHPDDNVAGRMHDALYLAHDGHGDQRSRTAGCRSAVRTRSWQDGPERQ